MVLHVHNIQIMAILVTSESLFGNKIFWAAGNSIATKDVLVPVVGT